MKLKRLVSAVLAVGMALTILPTAAFADNTNNNAEHSATEIWGLVLTDNGTKPNLENCDSKPSGSSGDKSWAPKSGYGAGWNWIESVTGTSDRLQVQSNHVFDDTTLSETVNCSVDNYGTIAGGTWGNHISNVSLITGGTFYGKDVSNRSGKVTGGLIENYRGDKNGWSFEDAVVWGTWSENTAGTVTSGIIPVESKYIASTSPYYKVSAPGCTIASEYNKYVFSIKEQMWVIGKSVTPAMTITVTPVSTDRNVNKWTVDGISVDPSNLKGSTITITIPAGNTEDITISAEMEKIDLNVSANLPTDGKNNDGSYGSSYDGWYYKESEDNKNEIQKNLTVYSDYTADISNEEVDWTVTNNGTVANGKYTGIVSNYGNITGGTYAGNFYNRNTTDNPNANAVREEGIVTSGVFSRSADFGTQNPDITWLNVNNGTINGIDGFSMAGVVGKQTVTVTTTDTNFTGWVVSGDSDLTLTEEQRTSKTLTLELDGSKKNTIVLTAMTPEGYQHFTVIDGKATNADGETITSAQPGHTVTLTANDAPDGMVFDRWEVTPTAAEAELEGFDASSATTTFKMGTQEITIRAMYRMADVEEPNVLGTVAVVATAGVGAAVLGWTGYNIAADLYAQSILPEGTAIPETKEALAMMLWQNAGKPEVVAADGTAPSETEQAQQWVVANGLMENEEDGTFHPEKGVGKFAALNAIKAQQETVNAQ